MINKFKKWWRKIWFTNPFDSSDVISVSIIRKSSDGSLWEMSLVGKDAEKWGFLINNMSSYWTVDGMYEMRGLKWKKVKLQ